ncbi:hypothetical protein MBOU_58820 [Mycobacterium bourgelatii]|uniref:Short-chain dehydrogenase n=1 Tax=Mycobacterium bourgelatii TaxID=1273442 RepID=A0A7I9YYM4_MYCBU|nr:hypothetical protein MBOU_58820 [Mycobacterium bourgelatii]
MTKWTTTDIPAQTGRTAVITGANTGLGFETAAALAAHGARVVLAVRNLEKGKEAQSRIIAATPGAEVELQQLDLGTCRDRWPQPPHCSRRCSRMPTWARCRCCAPRPTRAS